MSKVGRNDLCPCGSGKKFKQCCLLKKGGSGVKRKLTAKWLNAKAEDKVEQKKEGVDLMERAFGHAAQSTGNAFEAIPPKPLSEHEFVKKEKKNEEGQ